MRRQRRSVSPLYLRHKERARAIARARLAHFNALYQLPLRRIAIKNQKTRWGSCSEKGNLNFNYRIALLPQTLCDYVIVHELCHLAEFNHSPKFWQLVARAVPEYKARRKALQQIRMSALRAPVAPAARQSEEKIDKFTILYRI